jgi:hypothetical protein
MNKARKALFWGMSGSEKGARNTLPFTLFSTGEVYAVIMALNARMDK